MGEPTAEGACPNCGASDISFDGDSESALHARTLLGLIGDLDLGPTALAAGSAGELGRRYGMEQLGFWNRILEHPSYDAYWREQAVDRLLAAIRDGDLQCLLDVLAPDVVIIADGGGLVAAARRPIEGAERVAGFLLGGARTAAFEAKAVWLNGSPGARIDIGGELDTAVSLTVDNGRITHIYAVRNPHKLAGFREVAALTRS